jgi:hypothetical protein
MCASSTFAVLPETQPNLPFNVNDFVSIGFVGEVPMAIAASPIFPVNNLPELIAHSKRQPGGLNVAAGFRGGIPHLTAELFRSRSGADLATVLYPGIAQAMNDLISGRVPVGIEGLAGPMAAGQLKLLAVASPTRLASRPDVPTEREGALLSASIVPSSTPPDRLARGGSRREHRVPQYLFRQNIGVAFTGFGKRDAHSLHERCDLIYARIGSAPTRRC